jgi:Protein of unknown function (DUF2917)
MNSQASAVLSLAPGQARRIGLGAGEITVLRGRVWLTAASGPADGSDRVLSPGDSLCLDDAQSVVAEAWGRGEGASLRWQPRSPALQRLPRTGLAGAFFAAALGAFAARARNAASSASRAQGCIRAGDSIASSGAVK